MTRDGTGAPSIRQSKAKKRGRSYYFPDARERLLNSFAYDIKQHNMPVSG